MENSKISLRMMIALVTPMLGLIYFSSTAILDKRQTAMEMSGIQTLAELSPVLSGMVHEMQKERGSSAGFIGSKGGEKFAKKLSDQRLETNPRRSKLNASLDAFNASAFGASMQKKIAIAREALAQLDDTRKNVDGLALTIPQMAEYYTSTIAKLLSIIEEMAVLSSNAKVTNAITAYTQFLQGKERAGIERAMGSVGFSGGKFDPPVYRKFLQIISAQNIFMDTFNIYASAEQKAFLKSTVSGPDIDEVNRMRAIAIESPVAGNTGGVEGAYWFDTITKKINMLKVVEGKVSSDLLALAGEIKSSAERAYYVLAVITAVLLAVTVILVAVIVRGITSSLSSMTGDMTRLAEGDKSIEIYGAHRGDEIGAMARAVVVFKDNMIKAGDLAKAQKEAQAAKERRAAVLEQAIAELESKVSGIVDSVSTGANGIVGIAKKIGTKIDASSSRSLEVAEASSRTTANVETVASAAEELSSSISEISRQVAQSSEIAATAKSEAELTNKKVQGLSEAANKIGEVVGLITDIAEQTNLLALNATIEAARAGDAGKGFAVVASEVKNLANQTAKATEEIGIQIAGIQSATEESAKAIRSFGDIISRISETASATAAAVEEQGAATQEIARNIRDVSQNAQVVSNAVAEVSRSSAVTYGSAIQVIWSGEDLIGPTKQLREVVGAFLDTVRAD